MGPAEIAGAVVFFITVSGTLWGIWWRIEGRVEKARTEAIQRADAALAAAVQAQKDVTDLRLHASETFATKAGLTEALGRVHDALDRLTDRIDALIAAQSKP